MMLNKVLASMSQQRLIVQRGTIRMMAAAAYKADDYKKDVMTKVSKVEEQRSEKLKETV
jgi:hypothetical protein